MSDTVKDAITEKPEDAVSPDSKPRKNTAKKTAEVKPGGFVVYLGPGILGVIQSGAIFARGNPAHDAALTAAIAKFPLIKSLLVPDSRLAADRVKIKTPGNALYENYKRLAAVLKNN